MDIYMNTLLWSTDLQPSDHSILAPLKEIGYDGIEFCLGSPDRSAYEALATSAQALGLKLLAVCAAGPEVNATSPDPAIRKAAGTWIRGCIDDVAATGGTNLGGPFHCVFNHFTGTPVTEDEMSRCVDFLQMAGEYSQEKEVTLTPEFLNRYETYFGNTMAQCSELLAKVNHSNVRAMYDTYHANIEEKSQAEAIRSIGPYLTHVHISENDRGTPGRGQIDFDLVFATLKEVGFSGTIAIEAFNRQNQVFADAVNVWRDFSPSDEILTEGYQLVRQGTQMME